MSSILHRLFSWLFRTEAPPLPAPRADPERDTYRSSDPSTRDAATRYADPLGEVVNAWNNNPSRPSPAEQLAADLSGRYGPYTVKWTGSFCTVWQFGFDAGKHVLLEGKIFDGDEDDPVGICRRKFYRDDNGRLVVDNDRLELEKFAQRKGFSTALYDELERYYRRSGVDIMKVHATNVGGYTWATKEFSWDPDPVSLNWSLGNLRRRIEWLIANSRTHPDDRLLLRQICDRINADNLGTTCPTPKELVKLRGVDGKLGRKVMVGMDWHGIRRLST